MILPVGGKQKEVCTELFTQHSENCSRKSKQEQQLQVVHLIKFLRHYELRILLLPEIEFRPENIYYTLCIFPKDFSLRDFLLFWPISVAVSVC